MKTSRTITLVLAMLCILLTATSCSVENEVAKGTQITATIKPFGTFAKSLSYNGGTGAMDFTWKNGDTIDFVYQGATQNEKTTLTVTEGSSNVTRLTPDGFRVVDGKKYYSVTPSIAAVQGANLVATVDYTSQHQTAYDSTAHLMDYNFAEGTAVGSNLTMSYSHLSAILRLDLPVERGNDALQRITITTSGNHFVTSESVDLSDMYNGDGTLKTINRTYSQTITLDITGCTRTNGGIIAYLALGEMTVGAGDTWDIVVYDVSNNTFNLTKTFDSAVSITAGNFYELALRPALELTDENTRVYGVTAYGKTLSHIDIPEGVTVIGGNIGTGFKDCTNLESVTIPNTVTTIEDNAFQGCTSLRSIVIPDTVTSLGNNAFKGCTSLESVTLSSGLTSIENNAFDGCTNLSSLSIPNGVATIGHYAFRNCTSLASVTIPDSVSTIGSNAFESCSSLTGITLSSNVSSIGDYAFQYCSKLTSVNKGNGSTTIGDYAFDHCDLLATVQIPGTTSIGSYAFQACKALSSIVIPDTVASIGDHAFYNCDHLASVTLPDNPNFTAIAASTFNGCKLLGSITIPNTVTSIGSYAFATCKALRSIIIPKSVTSVGESILSGCTDLRTVTLSKNIESFGNKTPFNNCTSLVVIQFAGPKAKWDDYGLTLPTTPDPVSITYNYEYPLV